LTAAQGSFDERRLSYLRYSSSAPAVPDHGMGPKAPVRAFFNQISRLELGLHPEEDPILAAIRYVDSRLDCSDFAVAGLIRILTRYRESISAALEGEIEDCLLGFKYWYDERGQSRMCFWTENHQIIFHSDELLAGQLFSDEAFGESGKTGKDRVRHASPLVRRWMDWRARLGFSEWLSNCYFDEDLLALANLHDFADDPSLRAGARGLMDLIFLEIALHSHAGAFGSTHGRTYARMLVRRMEGTSSASRLVLGAGEYNDPASLSAVSLATGSYRCPDVIVAIAADLSPEMLCRERHGIEVEEAAKYDIPPGAENVPFFWGMGAYVHPLVVGSSREVSERYGVRVKDTYARAMEEYRRHGGQAGPEADPTSLTSVDIQTFRSPDYMLSCAQDYRPGRRGYQQHIWQATLGPGAIVFTNHPGSMDETSRPNFWAGNGWLPRAAQDRNVLVCVHRIPGSDGLPFSHAYFPRSAYDSVIEECGWILGAREAGYVALHSENPWSWHEWGDPGSSTEREAEARVGNPENAWICELGNAARWGSFRSFADGILGSRVDFDRGRVVYESPTRGTVQFGWEGPFTVGGKEAALHGYPRFGNPYCHADFGEARVDVRHLQGEHSIDLRHLVRSQGRNSTRSGK
jgi:hypothetical protein